MAGNRITLQIEGSPEDKGHPRLADLIKQLEIFQKALAQTERMVTGNEEREVYYRVVDLSHQSPATFVLEGVTLKPKSDKTLPAKTNSTFLKVLRQIKRGSVSEDVDASTLVCYKELTSPIIKNNLSKVNIKNGRGKPIELDTKFRDKIEKIIGDDELMAGSATGRLEWLNIHNKNLFNIYPVIGASKIVCKFPTSLRPTVIEAIDKDVVVFGILRYRQRDKFPYSMDVKEIEIMPFYEEEPTLWSLRGVAPNATGELTANDFVRQLRDENS